MATDMRASWEEQGAVYVSQQISANGDYDIDFGRAGISGLTLEFASGVTGTTSIAVKETTADTGDPADPVKDASGTAITITSASDRVTVISSGQRLIRRLRLTVSTIQNGPYTAILYGKRRQ